MKVDFLLNEIVMIIYVIQIVIKLVWKIKLSKIPAKLGC